MFGRNGTANLYGIISRNKVVSLVVLALLALNAVLLLGVFRGSGPAKRLRPAPQSPPPPKAEYRPPPQPVKSNASPIDDHKVHDQERVPSLHYADGASRFPATPPEVEYPEYGQCENPLYDTPMAPGELRNFPQRNNSRISKANPYGHFAVANKKIYILWWDRGGRNWVGDTAHPTEVNYPGHHRCPVTECIWTDNREKLSQADGVVFHIPSFDGFPGTKKPGQQYVAFTMENEQHYANLADPGFMKNFEWRAGYWLNNKTSPVPIGNILVPYMEWPWDELMQPPPPPKTAANPVSWVASNCHNTRNGRLQYIEELMKHIGIDNYGPCLKNKDVTGRLSQADKYKVMGDHKFYLAFENANVDDYVTEKIWQAYKGGTVPVYMGTKNIVEHVPDPHSYIDANKFSSAKELAEFLKIIANNEELYKEYLRWHYVGPSQQFKDLMKVQQYWFRCKVCMAVAGLDMDYTKW